MSLLPFTRRVRTDAELSAELVRDWTPRWRAVTDGCGLARTVRVPAGETVVAPDLVSVRLTADGPVLRVRPLPGQLAADYTAAATRLAAALGAVRVTATADVGGAIIVLRLLRVDPLAAPIRYRPGGPPGLLGRVEDGRGLALPFHRRGHMLVQGQTGSGKSVFTYGQLAAADAATDVPVLIAGLDPSGLLWRPFAGTRHAGWQVSGLSRDLADHLALLDELVADMDERIAAIPDHRDSVVLGPALPVVLVVLEEYPGLLRAADLVSKAAGQRVRAQVARLLAEGRKAGYRVLLVAQRADANVVDGLVRAQCSLRVSFSVDSPEAVRMLHPGCLDPADVLAAPPGVALITRPGTPVERFRAPHLPYARYSALVARRPAA